MIGRSLSLEDQRLRLSLFVVLLALALFGPQFALPGDLPAVRPEQVLLVLLLPSLAGFVRRHPPARRATFLDLTFAIVIVLTMASVALAPFIDPALGRTYHDLFDVLRPIEYWLLYRFALIVPDDDGAAAALILLGVAGLVSGLLAGAQRYGGAAFNNAVTVLWTGASHNLDVVIRGGRAVGTIGNPNSFGIACSLLVLILFVAAAAWRRGAAPGPSGQAAGRPVVRSDWPWLGLILVGLGLAIAGGVYSQSRSAAGGALVAGVVALVVLVWGVRQRSDRSWADLLRPIVVVILAGGLSAIALSQSPPTANGSTIGQRFDVGGLTDDTSVVVRLARLHVAFAKPDPGIRRELACQTGPPAAVQAGHEPQPIAARTESGGAVAALSPAGARDAIRKGDVAAIAARLTAAYCVSGVWSMDLAAAWTSGAPPRDPLTGQAYPLQLGPTGYLVSARLEVSTDPDGPTYALTNAPDLIVDPSFEGDGSSWETGPGTAATVVAGGRFGQQAFRVSAGPTAQVHQYVLYAFEPGTTYTAQVWARATAGQSAQAHVVAVAWYTDNRVISPIGGATASLPSDGTWVPLRTTFTMPSQGQIWVLELFLEPGQVGGAVDFDGVSLTRGAGAPSFSALREVDPAILPSRSPAFWSSPVLGLGSLSAFDLGAFDNEYVRILVHFGILGLLAYLLLLAATAWAGLKAWRDGAPGWGGALGLGIALTTLAVLIYDIAAGVYFSYQLMAIYWLIVGIVVAGRRTVSQPRPSG